MNIQKLLIKALNSSFTYILLIIAVLGFLAAYKFFGNVFAIKSLGFVIPITLAAIILLIRYQDKGLGVFKSITNLKEISLLNLFMVTMLLFIISIIILIHFPTRPWAYFIVIALTSGSIFIQILTNRAKWTDYLIIFEIILLSLNLIWGVVLKYPLYFGSTDILQHLFYIETVLETSHIADLQEYVYYPLFHIYNAIAVEITGLDLRTSLFLFMGIAWEVGILFTYLLFKKISSSGKFSLTACLLFAMSPEVIFNGMYAITRSLAFVLILCWSYLILTKDNFKYVFLALITLSALILMHHTTVLLSIPILIMIYISQRIFRGNKPAKSGLTLLPIMTLTIFFLAYLFFVASDFSSSAFARQLLGIFGADTRSDINIAHQSQYYYLFGNIHGSFILFFSLIGIGVSIRQYALGNKHLGFIIIGLPSIFFLLMYFGNLSQLIPNSDILLLWRLPILVSPFIVYMTTYGLNYLMHLGHNLGGLKFKKWLPAFSMVAVVVITFSALITSSVANDVNYVQKSADMGSTYFTNSELKAFSFVRQECNYDSTLYGDYETIRNAYNLNSKTSFEGQIIQGADISYINRGYLILRSSELQKSGGLNFSFNGYEDRNYRYHTTNSEKNILESLSTTDCIYSDGDVQLFIINNTVLIN
jgi:hypothetical protein